MQTINEIMDTLKKGLYKCEEHAWTYDEEVDEDNFICEVCAESKSTKEPEFDKREDINERI